jgi:hypothetical protein
MVTVPRSTLPPEIRERLDGRTFVSGAPGRVEVFVPIRLQSEANQRDNHFAKARRVKRQREAVSLVMGATALPALPATVTLTRIVGKGGRLYDDDNAVSSMKAVRDAIAALYGVNDGGTVIHWEKPGQERGPEFGVRIVIESVPAQGQVSER